MRISSLYLFTLLSMIPAFRAAGMGRPPEPLTVLMVPARHSLVQLGRDMADRERVLLMTYAPETASDALFLHAWDGGRWVRVAQRDYADGSFLLNPSARLLVIGPANDLTATLIERGIGWSPEVLHLESQNVTNLINALGRLFDFKKSDWEWFAGRYELSLEDLNTDVRQQSWYDTHRASELPPPINPLRKPRPVEAAPRTSLAPILSGESGASPEAPEESVEGVEAPAEEMEVEDLAPGGP